MWILPFLLGGCFPLLDARGPICLHGANFHSPDACTDVKECWPWESCFAEQHVDTEGNQHFNFGCRVTQGCEANNNHGPAKRFDLKLCDKCCTEDVCNVDVCANGTAPGRGLPCLHCTSVPTVSTCNQLTYCHHGEVCFAERKHIGPNPTYNIGCLRQDVCSFFEEQLLGKRSAVTSETSSCHECCKTPGCNRDACSDNQHTTPETTGYMTTGTYPTAPTTSLPPARDCWDLRSVYNITVDGVYTVLSPDENSVSLSCDMTTDGGGWIVFQRRQDGVVNFNQNYETYSKGFGFKSAEFWMGNDLLHEFTKDKHQRLRVDICDWSDYHRYAEYESFYVNPKSDQYRLMVANYSGDAGDALVAGSGGDSRHNYMRFSTPDADNDIHTINCAERMHSGWWFGGCYSASLNGLYFHTGILDPPTGDGIQWRPWHDVYSFKGTEMKFRPTIVPSTNPGQFSCPIA